MSVSILRLLSIARYKRELNRKLAARKLLRPYRIAAGHKAAATRKLRERAR